MKRLKWFRKKKSEGHKIKILDNEPTLNEYEELIIKTAKMCNSVQDVIEYSKLIPLVSTVDFVDSVLIVKQHL